MDIRYADVAHTVQRVTSGFRFALMYSLISVTPDTLPCASNLGNDKQLVVEVLHKWNITYKKDPSYRLLAYFLEHGYSEADLMVDKLRGKDLIRAKCLRQACQEQGFSLFLASIEQVTSGMSERRYHGYGRYGLYGGYYDDDEVDDEDDEHHQTKESCAARWVTVCSGPRFRCRRYLTGQRIRGL